MRYVLIGAILFLIGCSSQKKKREFQSKVSYTGAQAVVYKTKNDYRKNIPVMLNEGKDSIMSYPSKGDLARAGVDFVYPVILHKGYLLDIRGIGPNTAFLKYTYEEYFNLPAEPTEKEMLNAILDNDPIKEIYNLGSRYQYKNLEDSINAIIDNGDLKLHKRIK